MIEKTLLDFLNDTMDVPAYMEIQDDMPEEYILLEKTGGKNENYISESTIAIQSISTTLYKACLLNDTLKTRMQNITLLNDVSRCKLNTDYNFTDTKTKKYRYQAIYDIVHY